MKLQVRVCHQRHLNRLLVQSRNDSPNTWAHIDHLEFDIGLSNRCPDRTVNSRSLGVRIVARILLLEDDLVGNLESFSSIVIQGIADLDEHGGDALLAVDVDHEIIELVVNTEPAIDVSRFDAVRERLAVSVGGGELDFEELSVEDTGGKDPDLTLDVDRPVARDG